MLVNVPAAGVTPPITVPLIVPPVILTLLLAIFPLKVLPEPEIIKFETIVDPPLGVIIKLPPLELIVELPTLMLAV